MRLFALLALTGSAAAAPAAHAPTRVPSYSSTFSVHTVEVDDTLGKNSVYQTIAEDSIYRRSFMSADGVLSENAGILEQVRRCDLHPLGYFLDISGAHGSTPTTWTCTNSSIDPAPADCQFSPFWDLPSNVSYVGPATINGTACERWEYWESSEKYNFFGTPLAPLRIAKVFTAVPGYALWHIDFTDYTPYTGASGGVPLNAFTPTQGVSCPPATPMPPSPPAHQQHQPWLVQQPAAKRYLHNNVKLQKRTPAVPAAPATPAAAPAAGARNPISAADACLAGVNVTFDNTVYQTKYMIATEAPAGSAAVNAPLTQVSAVVVGALRNGSVFWDSGAAGFTYTFDASPRQLIVGFDVGSFGMKVGETRVLCIPPAEGYGNTARRDPSGKVIIPANSTLVFTLTCSKIAPP